MANTVLFTKYPFHTRWILLLSFAVNVYPTSAENTPSTLIRCRSEIRYTWRKADEEKEREVYFTRVEASGADEAEAKNVVARLIEDQREQARRQCSNEHENQSSCLSAKFLTTEPVRNTLSFNARKAFEEAIVADCANSQGICGEVRASEMICITMGPAKSNEGETAPASEEKGKEKGDDKKKKKK